MARQIKSTAGRNIWATYGQLNLFLYKIETDTRNYIIKFSFMGRSLAMSRTFWFWVEEISYDTIKWMCNFEFLYLPWYCNREPWSRWRGPMLNFAVSEPDLRVHRPMLLPRDIVVQSRAVTNFNLEILKINFVERRDMIINRLLLNTFIVTCILFGQLSMCKWKS